MYIISYQSVSALLFSTRKGRLKPRMRIVASQTNREGEERGRGRRGGGEKGGQEGEGEWGGQKSGATKLHCPQRCPGAPSLP